MIRTTRRLALVALMLIAPLSAQAIGVAIDSVSSSGGDASLLQNGDVLTVNLVVNNASDVNALGLAANGYDADGNGVADDGLSLFGGQVTTSVFNTVYVAIPVADGLENNLTGVEERGNPFVPVPITPAVELHAQVFEGASLTSATGNGSFDNGINGTETGLGDVHFQVQFVATAGAGQAGLVNATQFTLFFGGDEAFGNGAVGPDGSILPVSGSSYTFAVIPEPGTALLMGLGLAGLATSRRR